jgi:hypothetical protein
VPHLLFYSIALGCFIFVVGELRCCIIWVMNCISLPNISLVGCLNGNHILLLCGVLLVGEVWSGVEGILVLRWCGGVCCSAAVLVIIVPRVVLGCPRLWQLKTRIILLFWQCSLQMKLAITIC